MTGYTIDEIVREELASRRMPLHYYMEFMLHAIDIYRKLHFNNLRNTKLVKVQVPVSKAFKLPADFVDEAKVYWTRGGSIVPLGWKDSLQKPEVGTVGDFEEVDYDPTDFNVDGALLDSEREGGYWGSTGSNAPNLLSQDKFGNLTGGEFGRINEYNGLWYRTWRADEILALDPDYPYDYIYLEYIDDGTSTTALNLVHPYAVATIRAYCWYKFLSNRPKAYQYDKMLAKEEYENEYTIMRGQLSRLDITTISRIIDRHRRQA